MHINISEDILVHISTDSDTSDQAGSPEIREPDITGVQELAG